VVSLKNIITHILQNHGYEVFEKDGVLYGEKDDDCVSIGLFDIITVADLRSHAKAVSSEASRHIVCVLSSGAIAEQEAIKLGITIWKKGDIEAEIGHAMQAHIQNVPSALLNTLVNPPDEAMDAAPITIESLGTEGRPIVLKSRLSLEDIKEISKNTIQGFKHDLELVPHYIFHYSCSYEGKDGATTLKDGLISINALTGKYAAWEKEPEIETGAAHQVQLEPKIDGTNAMKIALHAVAQLNTEYKELIIERDHATIIEKAVFKPEPDAIKIDSQKMVMVPVWCVEGKHGVMILDGLTGKIISENYYEGK
jgi:hypothetical protein